MKDGCTTSAGVMVYVIFLVLFSFSIAMSALSFDSVIFVVSVSVGILTCILSWRRQHGCNFWHWELEYVEYLVDRDILQGNDAIEAIGWAEERREQLLLRKAEKDAVGQADAPKGRGKEDKEVEQKLLASMDSLVHAVKKVELLLTVSVTMLFVLCVLVLVKISNRA
jgi:hypothetical protein